MNKMDWVDKQEEKSQEERSKSYFNIEEGDNRIQLLTHCAPLAQRWTGSKYEIAQEGDKNVSIKGVCYVLQDGVIKSAKLPYTVVKAIRALQQDADWAFSEFPMPRLINIKAKGAGTKEVEYSVTPSPKETKVPKEILEELKTKLSPEEIIEKMKEKVSPRKDDYPENDVNPDDVPF